MLGILDVPDPATLSLELDTLRQNLLNDLYFKKIPSMQPENRKTALAFHAKDDLPEIRWEVFKLLIRHPELRFFAVVRDKESVRQEFLTRGKKYHPNLLYDNMVSRLFKDRLHKENEYQIYFAKRGKADRTQALHQALAEAQKRFEKKWGIASQAHLHVKPMLATKHPCLQASDYFLWALQRLYERREDRYLNYVWPMYHLVHDVDDIRDNKKGKKYGIYYTQKNH